MLQTILLVLHVIVALALITFILLQQGKGAATGAAFGSGASSTVFGARGSASFLSRTTSILAIVFFSNCLLLAFLGGQRERPTSIVEQIAGEPVPAPAAAPAAGAPAPATTAAAPAKTDVPAPAANEGAADVPVIPPAQKTP